MVVGSGDGGGCAIIYCTILGKYGLWRVVLLWLELLAATLWVAIAIMWWLWVVVVAVIVGGGCFDGYSVIDSRECGVENSALIVVVIHDIKYNKWEIFFPP